MALAVAWVAVPPHPRFTPGTGRSPLLRRGEGMTLAVAWAAVPPHPRFKPGAGSSPLPRRGEGMALAVAWVAVPSHPRFKLGAGSNSLPRGREWIVAPVRPPGIPCVRFAPRPSVGRLGFAKGTGPFSSGKGGGCCLLFGVGGFYVLGFGFGG